MTASDYRELERILAMAEDIATAHPLETMKGKEISDEIRALLLKVTCARIKAELDADRSRGAKPAGG